MAVLFHLPSSRSSRSGAPIISAVVTPFPRSVCVTFELPVDSTCQMALFLCLVVRCVRELRETIITFSGLHKLNHVPLLWIIEIWNSFVFNVKSVEHIEGQCTNAANSCVTMPQCRSKFQSTHVVCFTLSRQAIVLETMGQLRLKSIAATYLVSSQPQVLDILC